jgi:hypothetical protein
MFYNFFLKWTKVLCIQLFFFHKKPPKMAEQMQARYTDHGNSLQKSSQTPLRNQNPANAQGAPTRSKGAPP